MKRLLWIGSVESESEFQAKVKKGYSLASAQIAQMNIITGIEKVTGMIFDSINGCVVPPYPIYANKMIEEVSWEHIDGAYDVSVGFENLKYINRVTCKNAMLKATDGWVQERYHGEDLIVFAYSMRSPVMATACRIKKLIPEAKIYLIVTDLPQFMDLSESRVKALLKKVDWVQIKKYQAEFDGFILFAEKMADYLNIPDGEWIVMEGTCNSLKEQSVDKTYTNTKALMYSGMIEKKYGLDLLLNAFMTINDPEAELWITGGGSYSEGVKLFAQRDHRIKYFGFLPSRDDVLAMQQKAMTLINMRLPSEEASKYCFPSKLFEYMATGKPVLSFHLAGIPKEYFDYLICVPEETVNNLAEKINEVFAMSESQRSAIGKSASKFVTINKTVEKQSEKVWKWVCGKEVQ